MMEKKKKKKKQSPRAALTGSGFLQACCGNFHETRKTAMSERKSRSPSLRRGKKRRQRSRQGGFLVGKDREKWRASQKERKKKKRRKGNAEGQERKSLQKEETSLRQEESEKKKEKRLSDEPVRPSFLPQAFLRLSHPLGQDSTPTSKRRKKKRRKRRLAEENRTVSGRSPESQVPRRPAAKRQNKNTRVSAVQSRWSERENSGRKTVEGKWRKKGRKKKKKTRQFVELGKLAGMRPGLEKF